MVDNLSLDVKFYRVRITHKLEIKIFRMLSITFFTTTKI